LEAAMNSHERTGAPNEQKTPGTATLVIVSGVAAVVAYLSFAITAFVHYSGPYGPNTNWLSDLGNPLLNPAGSIYYRAGSIVTALILIWFYIELRKFKISRRRIRVLWIIGQAGGVFSSIALIVTGVFPLGTHTTIHSLWSSFIYMSMAVFEAFSATVLFRNWGPTRWVGIYGMAATVVNFVTGVFFNQVYIGEWLSVSTFIIYILLISGLAPTVIHSGGDKSASVSAADLPDHITS
jgi:hypothetical membrane protein